MSNSPKKYVIIVAGGNGKRMFHKSGEKHTYIPKQFLLLAGIPILMQAIKSFYQFDNKIHIIIVLPKQHILLWRELCNKHLFTIKHDIVEGGKTRFYSVKNGLDAIQDVGLIAVHDGVRSLVSQQTIQNAFETAEKRGNAIPVIPINDSIRKIDDNTNISVDRNQYYLVQTPQCFDISILKKAYQQEYKDAFSDDASVVEATGEKINMVDGNRENIKITTPFDLKIAEEIVRDMDK